MAIKMVREPSETPNINNIDDIIPMRYAYGGQNGFVIGKGTEISNTVSGLNFTVNSGRLVLQGVECDIDATGVTIIIDNIATKRYYTIYLEVNLGLNTATIKSEYDTVTYPTIDAGDDLTENTTGIARLPLYQFTATSGIISEVNKVVKSVKYVNQDFIKNIKVNNALNSDNANKINNLNIKENENGILQNSGKIIPQLEILYDGEQTNINRTTALTLLSSVNNGDKLLLNIQSFSGNNVYSIVQITYPTNFTITTSYSMFSPFSIVLNIECYNFKIQNGNQIIMDDGVSSGRSVFTISSSIQEVSTTEINNMTINKIYKIIE